jgi:hypothetical protein
VTKQIGELRTEIRHGGVIDPDAEARNRVNFIGDIPRQNHGTQIRNPAQGAEDLVIVSVGRRRAAPRPAPAMGPGSAYLLPFSSSDASLRAATASLVWHQPREGSDQWCLNLVAAIWAPSMAST